MSANILVVDDETAARYAMRKALEREGYRIGEASGLREAEREIQACRPDVILLDLKLGDDWGLDLIPAVQSAVNPPAVIVLTAFGSERLAVEAMKKGAFDYLSKPYDIDELRATVRNALELVRLRAENRLLKQELVGAQTFGDIVGSSPAMTRVNSIIEKVAPTDANVLILGESGTGKELVAREIHRLSGRSGPFVAVNSASIPAELIESELFGHEKGAFTGAASRRLGKFEAARQGTLFLDEVGDMSAATQSKLLRAIEDKSFHRLGSNDIQVSDARIISATNKDLHGEAVPQGLFREDLYYRLCVVAIYVPPLRERKSDIPALVETFCRRFSIAYKRPELQVSQEGFQRLLAHDWPGNVRELKNCIERAVVLADSEGVTLNVFPQDPDLFREKDVQAITAADRHGAGPKIERHPDKGISVPGGMRLRQAKREFEQKYVERSLDLAAGNITQAAQALGIHRQSLQQKIKELGLAKRFHVQEMEDPSDDADAES